LPKPLKPSIPHAAVRTRRAYFDCRFGQLHVRTAFPTTGGFDEQVTLFCVHPVQVSSRLFGAFLAEIADVRSVYAPDLPGRGESDPSPSASVAEAADAIFDLASDLRLRQIDLLGVNDGAAVAAALAAAKPELVRRLVLSGLAAGERLSNAKQPSLILRARADAADVTAKIRSALPNARFVEVADYSDELFASAPKTLAAPIGAFLSGQS
jgi:pimeloyl-ACP methyl ester carboxylesterase